MLEEEKAGGCGQDHEWKGGPESGSLQGSRQEIMVMGGGGRRGRGSLEEEWGTLGLTTVIHS